MSEQLKPCPFCGGEATLKKLIGIEDEIVAVYVYCKECKASTITCDSSSVATETWNRRAYEQK